MVIDKGDVAQALEAVENIGDALTSISTSLDNLTTAVEAAGLGVRHPGTSMGAIELLALEIKNGLGMIADGLSINER
jgi:hypothetical protein|tara:strand:- start:6391 stop:6621 length:231 start_codon:yes stop_codon:yes gene_type:complete